MSIFYFDLSMLICSTVFLYYQVCTLIPAHLSFKEDCGRFSKLIYYLFFGMPMLP